MMRAINIKILCFGLLGFLFVQCSRKGKIEHDLKYSYTDTVETVSKSKHTTLWIYDQYYPIGDVNIKPSKKETILNKFKNLKIELQDSVIRIAGRGVEKIYSGKVATLGYLKYEYVLSFYKKLFRNKYSISLEDSIFSFRSYHPYSEISPLHGLFIEGFIIQNHLFVEKNGLVISFKKK